MRLAPIGPIMPSSTGCEPATVLAIKGVAPKRVVERVATQLVTNIIAGQVMVRK
jgi:hypothetical protein